MEELKVALKQKQDAQKKVQDQLRGARRENDEIRRQQKNQAEVFNSANAKFEREKESLKKDLEKMRRDHSHMLEGANCAANVQLGNAMDKLVSAHKLIEEKDGVLAHLNTEVAALKTSADNKHAKEFTKLQQERDVQQSKVAGLERALAAKKQELVRAKVAVENSKRDVAALSAQVKAGEAEREGAHTAACKAIGTQLDRDQVEKDTIGVQTFYRIDVCVQTDDDVEKPPSPEPTEESVLSRRTMQQMQQQMQQQQMHQQTMHPQPMHSHQSMQQHTLATVFDIAFAAQQANNNLVAVAHRLASQFHDYGAGLLSEAQAQNAMVYRPQQQVHPPSHLNPNYLRRFIPPPSRAR